MKPSSCRVGSTPGRRRVCRSPRIAASPWSCSRQVQIGAGSLTLLGVLLGLLASPWFYAIPAVVGAGLVTAGATGFCGMARLLMRAPWNKSTFVAGATKLA